MKYLILMMMLGLCGSTATAQHYQALNGSSYSGALGVHANPATSLNTPFKWDIALAGLQLQSSSNIFSIRHYTYLSSPANSLYHIDSGRYPRKVYLEANLNLLNVRVALNRNNTIAFGANIRSYTSFRTSEYYYSDTLHNRADFLKANQDINYRNARLASSSWLEGYISYARTISDNAFGRLNGGITLKISKGLSGAYLQADNVLIYQSMQGNASQYSINAANMTYGYSSNYDRWKESNSTGSNIRALYDYAKGGASLDAGIEYLIKPQGTTSFNDEPDDIYDYDWKLGLSLLDIGGNRYRYGTESRLIYGLKNNINGNTLDQKFDSTISSLRQFNDSLSTLANGNAIGGQFVILNPSRLVFSIDRYLSGNFYLNATVSANIPLASIKQGYQQVKTINLLTLTPRWETANLGAYLPVQFNNQHQLWVGLAVKAGPLLLGVHNLANLFSASSVQNGGGYLALIIHSWGKANARTDKRLTCPRPVR